METSKRLLGRVLMKAARSLGVSNPMPAAQTVPIDIDRETVELWERVRSRTMTSIERIDALRKAVEYIHVNAIAADIVECGVWRGGSMIAAALTLKGIGAVRRLWLYDTFRGMTPPRPEDVDVNGRAAADLLASEDPDISDNWAKSTINEVQRGLFEIGYPS